MKSTFESFSSSSVLSVSSINALSSSEIICSRVSKISHHFNLNKLVESTNTSSDVRQK